MLAFETVVSFFKVCKRLAKKTYPKVYSKPHSVPVIIAAIVIVASVFLIMIQ